MNIEKKQMQAWRSDSEGVFGHIKLDKLAIPETVKVTLLGEPIIPVSFDIYGHPNFTSEQQLLCMYKEEELIRKNGGKYIPLELEVVYEEKTFEVPRSEFDSLIGIRNSILSLSDLYEMIENRKIFHRAHENAKLGEFILFGHLLLDSMGNLISITKTSKEISINDDVEDFEVFMDQNRDVYLTFGCINNVPKAGSVCPCCGKHFTIDDVKNNSCAYVHGKFYHINCWKNYRKLTEIDKFTRNLIGLLYKDNDYTFELLPNGYCKDECCAHIPWFLFHTIDGDIKIGWRKRVISIEWQENYKPFDFDELFKEENVTKWVENGKRGIHAWGKDMAYEYLKKVLNAVTPEYSKF